jgi:hypothetical protein
MNIRARGRSLGWVAVVIVIVMLFLSVSMLLDGYRTRNQRLIMEIQQSLGASSLLQCMENISAERDPAYFPLLDRISLVEYLNSNPPTSSQEQQTEGVHYQVLTDRYEAIWALTHESQARKARTVQQFSAGADHFVILHPEFRGMNSLLIPTLDVPLELEERVVWAARSLECIEGYLGGGFLIDEITRVGLTTDWILQCRLLLFELESPDHLRQLLGALDGVEPPVEAFRRAMEMEYVSVMEALQASRSGAQRGSNPFYREPGLNYVLSQLKTRIMHIGEPVEPLDSPWYASSSWGAIFLWGQGDDFINDTLQLCHELEDGMKFFREALGYRIARLEGGDQATAPQGLTVESLPSGEIRVIWKRQPVEGPTLPELFEPYRFPG